MQARKSLQLITDYFFIDTSVSSSAEKRCMTGLISTHHRALTFLQYGVLSIIVAPRQPGFG
jgi:hypothetical protein